MLRRMSETSIAAIPARPAIPPIQSMVAASSAGLVVALAAMSARQAEDWRAPALALAGVALGFVLLKSNFGFAGSFRAALERGDWSGFRAQALALALCSLAFFPLLAQGSLFGMPLSGFGARIGVSFLSGAVLFGIGMQIGGGCASGTLFALGGGDGRLLLTLAFFVAGSALGAAQLDFWQALPALDSGAIQDHLGWPLGLALHLAIFAGILALVPAPAGAAQPSALRSLARGQWPLLWGATGLALLNATVLVLAGRPWGETSGFTLWGSQAAALLGFEPATWPYWRGYPAPLAKSVFADITSIMDFGIVLGAALAAALGGRFKLASPATPGPWLGAALGGLLMGYGARLSDGCNIGAYFSALASGSLSGWAWVAAAFAGSAAGLRLRPWLGLD